PPRVPVMNRSPLDGAAPSQLTTRYLGSTVGIGRDTIYFGQAEQRRNVGFYTDLYAFSRANGSVRQLTSDARLLDPDLSPDNETLVCTRDGAGQRDLVTVRPKSDAIVI